MKNQVVCFQLDSLVPNIHMGVIGCTCSHQKRSQVSRECTWSCQGQLDCL